MIYLLVNKRTELLLLATSHITIAHHLCNQFNHGFALLISMPRFKSIYFCQNRPKITLLEQPTLASRVPLFLLGHFLTNECEISDFCL